MRKTHLMHHPETLQKLICDSLCVVLGASTRPKNVFMQVTVLKVLHRDEKGVSSFVPTKEFHKKLQMLKDS
jgi:hypothetical protein